MAADPTEQLLRDIRNPAKYKATQRVAVFRPHTREAVNAKGERITVEVTPADLAVIARNSNQCYQSGHLNPLCLGHRKHDPNAPETSQPPIVGYIGDFKAEVVNRPGGPILSITHTEFVPVDKVPILREYPYRSAEYDPTAKVIDGCAALKRRPYLDLGTVQYTGGRTIINYALETEMDPMATGAAPAGDDDDEVFYSKWQKAKMRYEAEQAGTPPMDPAAPPMGYQAGTQPVNYSAGVQAQIVAMQRQQEVMRRQLVEAQATNLLAPLVPTLKFDYQRELKALVNLPNDQERIAHINYMQATYQELPSGQFIKLPGHAIGAAKPQPVVDPHVPSDAHEKTMNYMKSHPGMSYSEAQAKVTAGSN